MFFTVNVTKGKAVYTMKFVDNYLIILLLYYRWCNIIGLEAWLVQDALFLLPVLILVNVKYSRRYWRYSNDI